MHPQLETFIEIGLQTRAKTEGCCDATSEQDKAYLKSVASASQEEEYDQEISDTH